MSNASTDKVRVYQLARELGVDAKTLVDLCKTQGFDVKSHVSALDAEQRNIIADMVKKGVPAHPVASAPQPPAVVPPAPNKPVAIQTRIPNLVPPASRGKTTGVQPKEEVNEELPPPNLIASLPDVVQDLRSKPFEKKPIPEKPAAALGAASDLDIDLPPPVLTTGSLSASAPDLESAVKPVSQGAAVLVPPRGPLGANRPMTNLNAPRTPQQTVRPVTGGPALPPQRPAQPPVAGPVTPASPTPPAQAPRPAAPSNPVVNPGSFTPTSHSQPSHGQSSQGHPPQGPSGHPAPQRPLMPPRSGGPAYPRPGSPTGSQGGPGIGNRPRNLDFQQQGPRTPGAPAGPSSQSAQDRLAKLREKNPQQQRTGPGGYVRPNQGPGGPNRPRTGPGGPDDRRPGGTAPLPPAPIGPRKLAEIPKDFINAGAKSEDIARKTLALSQVGATTVPVVVDDEEDDKGKGKSKKPGGVAGRDQRHKERSDRQARRKVDIMPDDDDHSASANRARLRRRQKQRGSQPRKGKIPIELPITVRSLSEAMGVKSAELLMKLMSQGLGTGKNINSSIDPELAESIALEYGAELDVKQKLDAEDELVASLLKPDDPSKLKPRAPIVTIMGHVDHGKTSLLDCIRKSKVVDTEAGGITQVIRAWRVDIHGKPITFLDTPGHEAFTKMRARGANVTDIVVIVVAADDGVMPQTEEAINHAKAADVKIVVAINKVDLPNANVRRTEQQLYGLGLIPDTMGGDCQFIQTSAANGQGVEELLETLALVAEVEEFKANPDKAASGVCLEANISEGQGVIATIIVQQGTLKRGDIVLCGAAYGRVRAMYDDHGKQIQEAGPSEPVRLLGLDEAPNADDPFVVVPELAKARDISEKRKQKAQENSQVRRQTLSFDSLGAGVVNELKVILKADFRGSLEAIRKEIEKLQHDEVRVRVLHTGVGAITEGDVILALTSPNDTMVLGFNAEPDNRALALSEERGIPIRSYSIIYKLTEDVKAALEGRLKPKEEVIRLGRAVIREVFKITRVGAIAGCVVTQGIIERSAKVRVIRSGIVVYPPAERTASLESLKRFKDDVREVREGYECGMKIAGYDDIKVDDVIEAFKIEQIQRTLD